MRGICLVAAVILLGSCSSHPDVPANVAVVSERAPAVSGPLIDGGRFGPSDYRGRVLVVNFFNPACPPCRQEQPTLERDWRQLHGRGLQFVAIHYVGGNWPQSVRAARSYLKARDVTYPVVEDPTSRLARVLGIQGIPSTVLIDRHGEIRFRILGRVKPGELRQLLSRL